MTSDRGAVATRGHRSGRGWHSAATAEGAAVVVPCPLSEPGILLRMITPEPPCEPPGSPRDEAARVRGAVVVARFASGGLAASGVGAALAAFLLAVAAAERQLLPFGASSGWGHAGWSLTFVVAAVLTQSFGTPRARLGAATLAAILLAAVACLQWCGGRVAFAASLPLAAASLGVAVGSLPRRWPLALVATGTAAAIVVVWQQVATPEPGLVLAAAVASALFAMATTPASPRMTPTALGLGARWGRWIAWLLLMGSWMAVAPWHLAFGVGAPAGLTVVALVALMVAGVVRSLAVAAVATALVMAAGSSLAAGDDGAAPWAERRLAQAGTCASVFVRGSQELQLRSDGQIVDAAGPDRNEAPLLATLVQALAHAGDRVLVLGPGTGRVPAMLRLLQRHELDVVDWRPAARVLRPRLLADGPVAPAPDEARHEMYVERCASLSACLDGLPASSRQAIVVPEWLAAVAAAPDASHIQHAMRRVVGDGFVLQAVALDRVAGDDLHELFVTAAAAHAWNGLFVVGDAAVLVSGARPPDWHALLPFTNWSEDARWLAHRAHCGDLGDLRRSLLGTLRPKVEPVPELAAAVPGRAAALAVIRACLQPPDDVPLPAGGSTLLRWSALQAELRQAAAALRALGPDVGSRVEAQQIAARFLPIGSPSAILQAALGVAGADGQGLCAPPLASRRAHAIDPTFFADLPVCCRDLPSVRDEVGALEDLACLPPPSRLAVLCRDDGPMAVALRVRFPSACARALVHELAAAPLSASAQSALRELADPFVLAEAARVLRRRSGERELLGLWRADLAMPASIAELVRSGAEDRRALAAALRGRRDPSCHPTLAALLEAPELDVRRLAAEALVSAVGDRVPYDAEWPDSARRAAAERLRSLHNRAP